MSRISIDIPPLLNGRINEALAHSDLDHRDKGRLLLFAVDQLLTQGELPEEFKAICRDAKAAIREKQKKRYQELKA